MILAIVGFSDIIPLLVFAGFVALVWAILSSISQRNSKANERLARMTRPASLAEIEDPRNATKKDRFQGVMETAKTAVAIHAPLSTSSSAWRASGWPSVCSSATSGTPSRSATALSSW